VTVRDPDFKMVQVRANGTTVVRVTDPTAFLRQVIGTESKVDMEQITELIRRNIALAFNDMVMGSGLGAIDLQGRQVELSDRLREFVAQRVQAFGLGIDAVTMTISLPEEIQQAMTRGVARGLEESSFLNNVGDLDRYAQGRRADAMLAAAQNEGGGAAGSAIQAGLGVALGSQMASAAQGGYAQPQQPQHFAPQGAPPPLPAQQLFHFEQAGQPAGPYPINALRQFVASGQLTRDTVVWTEGMANWAPASTVPALQPLFSAPPPLPGTPPPLPQQ
jgi:membrane protease subunit (stomatin/prohibitin family)